ncbi:MAG: ABC transporter permease [Gemmatimonadetes bacterium]|nr:ABC transporter permease [Gemmatimonadota bacterium]MCB9505605.1 ABC transporter permease [Gemmatimonadales bacterium]MCB9518571.1 ABC transporter permease [Gemmatimonadales bacterium]
MTLLESILTGLDEARRHLGQTLLALAGVVLGTASIVTVLALFGGQAQLTQQYLDEVGGAGTLIAGDAPRSLAPTARELASERLTYRDARYLRARSTTLEALAPGWELNLPYRANGRDFSGQVAGAVPDYARINAIRPMAGRWLSDLDLETRSRVMVMGWKYADSLFDDAASAVGRLVNIGGKQFTVVGVMEREVFRFASWEDNALEYRNERAYIPLSTAFSQFAQTDNLSFMTLKAKPGMVEQAEDEVRALLYARHGVEDFELRPSGSFGGGGESGQFLLLFNYIFLVVGAISLFTGGIVIANILLASVVERVRDFGTRMALGATPGGVFTHVLAEALVVTVLGGIVGLAIGAGLTGTVARVMQLPAAVTPGIATLALGTSVVVGLAAGLYPAVRAGRLSPVEALRYG